MRYKVIVKGRTDTAARSQEQAAEVLAGAYRDGVRAPDVRVRVCTTGRQERDLTFSEFTDIVRATAWLLWREDAQAEV